MHAASSIPLPRRLRRAAAAGVSLAVALAGMTALAAPGSAMPAGPTNFQQSPMPAAPGQPTSVTWSCPAGTHWSNIGGWSWGDWGRPTGSDTFEAEYRADSTEPVTVWCAGDDHLYSAPDATFTFHVASVTETTTELALTPSRVLPGQPVTATATVTTHGGHVPSDVVVPPVMVSLGSATACEATLVPLSVDTWSGTCELPGSAWGGDVVATFPGVPGRLAASESVPARLDVSRAESTLTLTGPSTTPQGRPASVQATVAHRGAHADLPAPVGTVLFDLEPLSGGHTSVHAELDAHGVATLDLSGLPAQTYHVTAVYLGDKTHAPVEQYAPFVVEVTAFPTSTTVSFLDGAPLLGAPTTAVATVVRQDDGSPVTGGDVRFTTSLHSVVVPLGPDGTARWELRGGTAGDLSVQAEYLGRGEWTASHTGSTLAVQPATPTIDLEGPTAWAYGDSAGFSAHLKGVPDADAPTGIVEALVDGAPWGHAAFLHAGIPTLPIDLYRLAPGRHEVAVRYSGDASYVPTQTEPVVVEVARATPSLEIVVHDGRTTRAYGEAAPITANLFGIGHVTGHDPTGTVTYTVDGGDPQPHVDTRDWKPGNHTVTAHYPGDDHYAAATAELTFEVTHAETDTVLSGTGFLTYGDEGQVHALVQARTGPAPRSGSVTFVVDGIAQPPVPLVDGLASLSLDALDPGAHDVVATYSGSALQAGSTSITPQHVVVGMVPTTTTLTTTPTASTTVGTSTTATVSVTRTGTGTPITSGTVRLRTDSRLGVFDVMREVGADGTVTVEVPTSRVGDVVLHAEYLGTRTHIGSAGTGRVSVAAGDAAVRLTGPTTWAYGSPASFTATAAGLPGADAPTGTVTFHVDGMPHGDGPLEDGQAGTDLSRLAPGTYTVTATYAGDSTYVPVTTAPIEVVVERAPVSVEAVVDGPEAWVYGAHSTVSARVTGPAGRHLAQLGDATLTVDGGDRIAPDGAMDWAPGRYTVTATYPGSAFYLPATGTASVEVTPAATSVTLSGPDRWTWEHPAHVTATVTPKSGTAVPSGAVTFTVDGRPAQPVAVDAAGAATLDLGSLEPGDHTITATYAGDALYRTSRSEDRPVTVDAITTAVQVEVPGDGHVLLGAPATATVRVVRDGTTTPVTEGQVVVTVGGEARTLDLGEDGTVTVPVPTTTAGDLDARVRYLGTTRYTEAKADATVHVRTGDAGVTVSGPATWAYGSPAVVTGAVPGVEGADTPTGSLTFRVQRTDGTSEPLGTGLDVGSDQLTADLSLLAPGAYAVTAVYSGDTSYRARTSELLPVVVTKAPAAVLLEVRGDSTWSYGAASSVVARTTGVPHAGAAQPGTATLTATGGVVVAPDGAMPWAPGTYTVTASFPGDAHYLPAEQRVDVTVVPSTTTLVVPDATTTVGTPAVLDVRIDGGTAAVPTGGALTVQLDGQGVGSATVTGERTPVRLDRALPAGDHTLVVRYAGDDRYTASEHSVRLTVAGIPPRPATASGGDVQVTVSSQTLAPAAPVSITADGFVPGETVVFVLYSEPVILGTAVADDDGRATLEVAALPAGTELGQHTVRAIGGTSERVAEIPVTVAAVPEAPAPAAPVTAPAGPVGPVLTAPTAPATTAPAPSGPARPTALARTGSTAGPLVGLSALLVLTGAAALVLARRRGGRTA